MGPQPTLNRGAASPTALEYERPCGEAIAGVFRDGRQLVVQGGADISRFCVCCGRPSAGKPLRMHFPVADDLSSGPLGGGGGGLLLWIVAVVAIVLMRGKPAERTVTFGLCEAHQRRRRAMIWASLAALFAGIGVFACGLWASRFAGGLAHDLASTVMIAGPIIGALVALGIASRRPRLWLGGEGGGRFWINGAGVAFLVAQQPLPRG
jgi:hypothetical protein